MNSNRNSAQRKKPTISAPPLFAKDFGKPAIAWKRLSIDVDSIGIILACHLIVEHYLTKFLQFSAPNYFDWDSARLTFSHKLSLASGKQSPLHKWQTADGIRQLNVIRNKISHDVEVAITDDDVAILKNIIRAAGGEEPEGINSKPVKVIQEFTWMTCAFMAGFCTGMAGLRTGRVEANVKRRAKNWRKSASWARKRGG